MDDLSGLPLPDFEGAPSVEGLPPIETQTTTAPAPTSTSCPFAAMAAAFDAMPAGHPQRAPSTTSAEGIAITCPMTGTQDFLRRKIQEQSDDREETRSNKSGKSGKSKSSRDGSIDRRSSRSAGRSMRAESRASGRSRGSRASRAHSQARSNHHSNARVQKKFVQEKSGRRRTGKKAKHPPFQQSDVDKYAPYIRSSWLKALENAGYSGFGNAFYDNLFSDAPDLQALFTRAREEMAIKFVDMLATLEHNIEHPPKLHELLEDLSVMHIRRGPALLLAHCTQKREEETQWRSERVDGCAPLHLETHRARIRQLRWREGKAGVQAHYMKPMGEVLFKTIAQTLGPEWTAETKEAWDWVWAFMTESMARTLDQGSGSSSLVIMSWDAALEKHTEMEVGEMVYDAVMMVAPNLRTIFSRPRQVMAMKFFDMLSTIVTFADDEERMHQQLLWQGIRHVQYGAKPQHSTILGNVVISVMENVAGEEWSEDSETAWRDLWNRATTAMMVSIKDAEQHSTVVIEMWQGMQKKATPQVFGQLLVGILGKTHASLINGWARRYAEDMKNGDNQDNAPDVGGKAKDASDSMTAAGAGPADSWFGTVKKSVTGGGAGTMFSKRSKGQGEIPDMRRRKASTTSEHEDAAEMGGGAVANRESAETALGNNLWRVIELSMTHLWDPEKMFEKLVVIANTLFAYGVRSAHLPAIGKAMHDALHRVLALPCGGCGKDEWNQQISSAWEWLWKLIHFGLANRIDSAEADHPQLAAQSWAHIKATRGDVEIGDALFQELSREAPMVLHLFKRPKKLQSYMFMQAVESLVAFSEAPKDFFDGLRNFTILHIKYGVKSEYVKPFGKALMHGLEELAGDAWTPEVKAAWETVWDCLSSCVARSLNTGTNLITVSLVNGDLSKMEEAAQCAPRGERIAWMTEVELNGTVSSPLYWAIREGKLNIASFMVRDILAIRADRECYYYGRDKLFETHPDLVTVLVEESPELVFDLLDGLIWHSQTVIDGQLNVNYYVKELYADPDLWHDAWKSPLGVLSIKGVPSMFQHPVLNMVVDMKWDRFAGKMFMVIQVLMGALIGLVCTALLTWGCHCTLEAKILRYVTGGYAAVLWIGMSSILCLQVWTGRTLQIGGGTWYLPTIHLPRMLTSLWNSIRYIALVLVAVAGFVDECGVAREDRVRCKELEEGEEGGVAWMSVWIGTAVVLLWVQLCQVATMSAQLGALCHAIGRLIKQIVLNLVLVFICVVAFASALCALNTPGFEKLEDGIVNMGRVALSLATESDLAMEGWQLMFLSLFVVIVHIGLLSVLIAQVVKGYAMLYEDQEGNSLKSKAMQCVEVESFLSIAQRTRYFNEFNFALPVPFDSGDVGPPGGFQRLEHAAVRATQYYVPDRIIRSTGTASALEPWPTWDEVDGDREE